MGTIGHLCGVILRRLAPL